MTRGELLALADACETASGADRELDCDIAEQVYGWRSAQVGPDYDGQNVSEILTPDGQLYGNGFVYPPRGALPRWYHVPKHTADCLDPRLPKDAARKELARALKARATIAVEG